MSFEAWPHVLEQKVDAIVATDLAAKAAPEPKLNLTVGAYRDENGKPYSLPVVRKAEQLVLEANMDYEYGPQNGSPEFIASAVDLLFRADGCDNTYEDIAAIQTVSGTGALAVAMRFLKRTCGAHNPSTAVYVSDPTWNNHPVIAADAGFTDVRKYRYYDSKTKGLDFAGMIEDITAAPEGSIFVLHQCAHNPTGVDPTHAQWEELADLFIAKRHYPLFDSAYLGFASGCLNADAHACRHFYRRGIPFVLTQSFSKNMGLYNGRLGLLAVTLAEKPQRKQVLSVLGAIVRPLYGCPPAHAARLVTTILTDNRLRSEWFEELKTMSARIKHMRTMLRDELERLGTPGTWDHITSQIGMFSYLGLTPEQCRACQARRVFILESSRCNVSGLTEQSVAILAGAIHDAVTQFPSPSE